MTRDERLRSGQPEPARGSLIASSEFDSRTASLLLIVGRELNRARRKFDPFNSGHEGKAVIEEELDELWEHVKANTAASREAFGEAIQTAAMALRYAYDVCDVSAYEVATTREDGSYDEAAAAMLQVDSRPAVGRTDG